MKIMVNVLVITIKSRLKQRRNDGNKLSKFAERGSSSEESEIIKQTIKESPPMFFFPLNNVTLGRLQSHTSAAKFTMVRN